MLKNSFRIYCTDMWYQHQEEIMAWTGNLPQDYDSRAYFHKNKWHLKHGYLERYAQDNARTIQKQIKQSFKRGNL